MDITKSISLNGCLTVNSDIVKEYARCSLFADNGNSYDIHTMLTAEGNLYFRVRMNDEAIETVLPEQIKFGHDELKAELESQLLAFANLAFADKDHHDGQVQLKAGKLGTFSQISDAEYVRFDSFENKIDSFPVGTVYFFVGSHVFYICFPGMESEMEKAIRYQYSKVGQFTAAEDKQLLPLDTYGPGTIRRVAIIEGD